MIPVFEHQLVFNNLSAGLLTAKYVVEIEYLYLWIFYTNNFDFKRIFATAARFNLSALLWLSNWLNQ
jgi:hypothetical protein